MQTRIMVGHLSFKSRFGRSSRCEFPRIPGWSIKKVESKFRSLCVLGIEAIGNFAQVILVFFSSLQPERHVVGR